MIYKKWKTAFSRDSFDEAVQKALKEFNVSTIESLTPYQLKTLSAACTFLIALSIFCSYDVILSVSQLCQLPSAIQDKNRR